MATQDEVFAAVRDHLRGVRRSGPDQIMAFCPFHENFRTPAFSMSLSRGVFFCFSCQAKGTLETFLRNVGASTGGYEVLFDELGKLKPEAHDPNRPRIHLNEPIPEAIMGLFEDIPVDLEQEGFTDETLRYFEVGVDYQHNRIVYPIRDHDGQLVGLSGRSPDTYSPMGKYKIYDKEFEDFGLPPRPPLNKKSLLWNYNRVFPGAFYRAQARIILVEGFKGVMWLHQHGFPETIAAMGSFLSDEQLWLLEHLGASVYLMFDNDQAGRRATEFAGRRLSRSLQTYVVEYPEEYKQPTDLPAEVLREVVQNASSWFSYIVQRSSKQ